MTKIPAPGSAAPFFDEWTVENAERPSLAQRVRESRGPRNWGVAAAVATVLGLGVGVLAFPGASANADPSAGTWKKLRQCESSDNYKINTGNGYYGAYQFDLSTWRSVGGEGYPNKNSKAEQDYRALRLYRQRGWQPWECASILGLREDSDAGSRKYGDIAKPGSSGGSSSGSKGSGGSSGSTGGKSGVPAFPGGSHAYRQGERNGAIATFQKQMGKRGFATAGSGQYGPKTRAVVVRLQRLNGLSTTGAIDARTWRLAWTGRYSTSGTGSTSKVPAFPGGKHWYVIGERNSHIATFQKQMRTRGFATDGTGQFGPKTKAMVQRLQRQNGLVPSGLIGPNTWRLAWLGTYS